MEKTYHTKRGAIAVTGKRPGCVLIVGVDDQDEIHLLDEFEEDDCHLLVQKCFQYDEIHGPVKRVNAYNGQPWFDGNSLKWICDHEHVAFKSVFRELNLARGQEIHPVTPTIIGGDREQMYLYFLPAIKRLREHEHRRLHMDKDSLVLRYMAEIVPKEIAGLSLGDYPAIEAMVFAAVDATRHVEIVHDHYYHSRIEDQGVQSCDLLKVN